MLLYAMRRCTGPGEQPYLFNNRPLQQPHLLWEKVAFYIDNLVLVGSVFAVLSFSLLGSVEGFVFSLFVGLGEGSFIGELVCNEHFQAAIPAGGFPRGQ